jgi:hypothetical protein
MTRPVFEIVIDERFLEHRRRSTSLAGIAAGALATSLFGWHFYVDRVVSRDLLAVSVTFVIVKLSVLIWHRLRD